MTKQVPLTRGLVALVDDEDFERVMALGKWHASPNGRGKTYAARKVNRNDTMRLHTFLTGWRLVDHINGDGLDNRRANLRSANYVTNGRNRGPQANNTSGFKGVYFDRSRQQWRARIRLQERTKALGFYATAEEAGRAYDAAARELFGEFAYLNFPGEVTA